MSRTHENFRAVDDLATTLRETSPVRNLIRTARQRLGMSYRTAASRAGYSGTRWMNIEQGYSTVSRGQQVALNIPGVALARLAQAVGVTSAQLRAVGRDDAACHLERLFPEQARRPQVDRSLPTPILELCDKYAMLAEADRPELLRYVDLLVQWERARIARHGMADRRQAALFPG